MWPMNVGETPHHHDRHRTKAACLADTSVPEPRPATSGARNGVSAIPSAG